MPFFCLSGNVTAERFFPVLLLPGLTMGNASPEARKGAAPLKRGRSPLAGLPASGGSSAQVRGESCTLGASGPGRLGWACRCASSGRTPLVTATSCGSCSRHARDERACRCQYGCGRGECGAHGNPLIRSSGNRCTAWRRSCWHCALVVWSCCLSAPAYAAASARSARQRRSTLRSG